MQTKPIVFLSYAKEDRRRVAGVYRALRRAGFNPWMDDPPKPWHRDGIRPGREWDSEIRERIAEARVILLFLSNKSVTKRGYVQREYRLALNLVLERPPTSISLVPVLLEPCRIPDLRVDTASLRQFQGHPQYRSSLAELVQLVRDIVAPQPMVIPQEEGVLVPSPRQTSRGMFAILEAIRSESGQVAAALTNCIAGILRADIEAAQQAAWSARIEATDIDLAVATDALCAITDPAIAIGSALVLSQAFNRRRIVPRARAHLAKWLTHKVREVGAIAALLLAQSKRPSGDVFQCLCDYAQSPNRLKGGQALLRHLITPSTSLASLTEGAPHLVWLVFTNDPHLAGMELHHASFNEAPRRFGMLARHQDWRVRETAAAVWGADNRTPVRAKLILLTDEEPRVRFRALEGLLHATNGDTDLQLIMDTLLRNSVAKAESRSWRTHSVNDGKAIVAILEDEEPPPPTTSSFAFSSMRCDAMESLDPIRLVLRGVVAVGDYYGETKNAFTWHYGSDVPKWISESHTASRITG